MVIAYEAFESRTRLLGEDVKTNTRADARWIVEGTSDDAAAVAEARNAIPTTAFDGLILDDINITRLGPTIWEAQASYKDPDLEESETGKLEVGDINWRFDTGGGVAHITQSKKGNTTSYAAAGVTAKDFAGAINVGETVEGVDITIPALRLTAQAKFTNATITLDYINSVYSLTGKTNDAPWFGFAKGEILFLGATGGQNVSGGSPSMSFEFLASENVQNIVYQDFAGNDITVTNKGGHEYLWINYVPAADAGAKAVTMRPHTAFVEKVYEEGDFTVLGLGS